MKQWFQNQATDRTVEADYEESAPVSGFSAGGLLENLRGLWQWDEVAAEICQEGQARIAIVGLANAGKSMLFNRLRGWVISWSEATVGAVDELRVEPYGAFVLADLPVQPGELLSGDMLMLSLGEPDLLLYLIDGPVGVQPADYRWVAMLRATGKPLVVALNKCDVLAGVETAVLDARRRLGMAVIPVSAETGENVEARLLPALLDAAPRIAVPLGREIASLRRHAANRVIRQAALFAGLIGVQPIPLLDLPFQAMIQVGVVLRVGAVYGRSPAGGVTREVVGTVVGYLGLNYLAQTAVKFVPLLGWVVSSALSAAATLLIGQLAVRYYEAGATIPLRDFLAQSRQRLSRRQRRLQERLAGRRRQEPGRRPFQWRGRWPFRPAVEPVEERLLSVNGAEAEKGEADER